MCLFLNCWPLARLAEDDTEGDEGSAIALVVTERSSMTSSGNYFSLSTPPYHHIGSDDGTHSPPRAAPATYETRKSSSSSSTSGSDTGPGNHDSDALCPENKPRLGHEAERGSWCEPGGLLNPWRVWLLLLLQCLYAVRTEKLFAVCSRLGGCASRSCITKLFVVGIQYLGKSAIRKCKVRVSVV